MPSYKGTVTKRGYKYHYVFHRPSRDKPFILFLHGFPSTAAHWNHQTNFFTERGFGIIAPDLLGYGGTDKPNKPEEYLLSKIAADVIDILDAVNAQKIITIAHDWGCGVQSVLQAAYKERFIAFGYLSVGLFLIREFNIESKMAEYKKKVGSDLLGYWEFFNKDSAAKIIQENMDTFLSMAFIKDNKLWLDYMAPRGALDNVFKEKMVMEYGEYITPEEIARHKKVLLEGGLTGPLNWYKTCVRNLQIQDGLNITEEDLKTTKPMFFGGCPLDMMNAATFTGKAPNLTVAEFEGGHFIMLEKPNELNAQLEKWIKQLDKVADGKSAL